MASKKDVSQEAETQEAEQEPLDPITRRKLTQRLIGLQRNALLIAEECGNLALWLKRQEEGAAGRVDKR